MRIAVPALLAFGLGLVGATAAPAQQLTDALVSAYLTNSELEAQRASLRATDELVPQALSGWRPSLFADSGIFYNNVDNSGASSADFTTKTQALGVDQELYSGGQTVALTRRAEQLVRGERARLAAIEQDVLLDAVTVYTNLLAAQAVLEFSIQNENRLRRQLQATRDRFEVGEVTRTDVAQSEARLAESVANRVTAEGGVATAIAAYRQVVNQEPGTLVVPPPLDGLPGSEQEAQQLAEIGNPAIAVAQYELAAARADVDVATADLLPRLSLRGELTYADDPNQVLNSQRAASIGANLRVPLYQGGGEYSRVRQTKQIVRQRQDDLETTFRAVRNEVTSSWQSLVTATSQIDSITAQVTANEIAVDGSRQEALVGQRTTLDVLDQESDLFQSQVDLVRAKRDEIVASYQVKSSVGELTAQAIDLPVETYDADAYYLDVRNRLFGLGNGAANGADGQ